MRHTSRILLLSSVALGGCAEYSMMGAADMGVTQGGAQDIRLAREIIEGGGIPTQDYFTAEGLFSEHDLPIDAGECEQVLCPRSAAARIDPVDGSGEQILVQLGFGTKITKDTFQRRPLNLSVVVDVSGSMSDGKLDSVKEALHTMVDQLDAGDQVGLIAFDDSAWVEMGVRTMDDSGLRAMRNAVDDLRPRGGTNIEAGLQMGYGQVAPDAAVEGYEDRVMLFTDAQPNVGGTGLNTFMGMARYYSTAGIGVSVFGVGLDLGTELATQVSETRGGNYFYLADQDAIAQVFDDEFDYMVTPVAYDLEVVVTPTEGLELFDTYAAPLDQQARVVDFGASTLFLSERNGGMGLTLVTAVDGAFSGAEMEELVEQDLARFELRYETADDFELVEDEIEVVWEGGSTIDGEYVEADDMGVYKMSRLVDEYQALLMGADFCANTVTMPTAMEAIEEAALRLDLIATHLGSQLLADEASLMDRLAENVASGSGNCYYDPYGYY